MSNRCIAPMMAQPIPLSNKIVQSVSNRPLLATRLNAAHHNLASTVSAPSTSSTPSIISFSTNSRRLALCRASSGGEFLGSEIVQKEMESIMKDYDQLMRLMGKFSQFDIDGKTIYADQMEGLCERLKIFNMRAKLSEDPMVKEAMLNTNRQLMYMNTNLDAIQEGMVQQIAELRRITEAEKSIADPQQLVQFRKQLSESMASQQQAQDKLAQNLTMDKIMKDPTLFHVLMEDPQAMLALQEVVNDPKNIEKYKDKPKLYAAIKKLFDM